MTTLVIHRGLFAVVLNCLSHSRFELLNERGVEGAIRLVLGADLFHRITEGSNDQMRVRGKQERDGCNDKEHNSLTVNQER